LKRKPGNCGGEFEDSKLEQHEMDYPHSGKMNYSIADSNFFMDEIRDQYLKN
jgi:hypothetical protein